MIDNVVLLPGLGSPGWSMAYLGHRLRHEGLKPVTVSYSSCWQSLDEVVEDVATEIAALGLEGEIGIVGHSMGGLVSRALAVRGIPGLSIRRIAMVGTPLLGVGAAATMARLPVGWLPFGRMWKHLSPEECGQNGEPVAGCEIAMIAGAVPGGRLLAGEETDGVVPISATRGHGLAMHVTVPASHASLLLSRKVADLACRFVMNGASNDEEPSIEAA